MSRLLTLFNSDISRFNEKYPLLYISSAKVKICKGTVSINRWVTCERNINLCKNKWHTYANKNKYF